LSEERGRREAWKNLRRNAGYGLFVAVRALLGALPAGPRLEVGALLGSLAYRLAGRERRRAIEHLERAFGGEKEPQELRRIARESFRNLGRSAAEICGLWRAPSSAVLDLVEPGDAPARADALLAGGRGLVVVTAHLDNWELLGAFSAQAGYPLTAVARRIYFEKYDRLAMEMRRKFGLDIIYQDESPRKLLRALRDGRMLALLADQDIRRVDGLFVPFLGKPAYTPTGPVSLALSGNVPLVLIHTVRNEGGKHSLFMSEPIEFDRSDKARALLEGTRAWTALLEQSIRRWPEQWVWMHRRWRTRLEERPEAARRSGYEVPAPAAAEGDGPGARAGMAEVLR
jgi:KDO2-lipid IV(A) lauroyltransferase